MANLLREYVVNYTYWLVAPTRGLFHYCAMLIAQIHFTP